MLLTTNEEALLAVSVCRGRHSSLWQHQLNPLRSHQEEKEVSTGNKSKQLTGLTLHFGVLYHGEKGINFVQAMLMAKGIQSTCMITKAERVPQCLGVCAPVLWKGIFCSTVGNLLIHNFLLKSKEGNLLSALCS